MISVVIPMFNAELTIKKCLNSVLNQQYRDEFYEIIVVNDGSSDSSAKIVEDFIKNVNDPLYQIKLVNQVNKGVSTARNVGLRLANGEWVALLDSDDEWLPCKIERQMELILQNDKIDFIGTNRNGERFTRFGSFKFEELSEIPVKLLLLKVFFVTPTVLFRRSIIEKVGYFDENQRFAEEGDYWIRVCNEFNCYLLNESLVITGGGKPNFGFSGLSSNLLGMEKGELKNLKTAKKMKIISTVEFLFLYVYSCVKFLRRVIIVKLRG